MQRLMVLMFIAVVGVAPFLVGDVFPSTTAARFRDPVASYCQFRVYDPQGRELPPAAFGLQRNFAGLPVGLGAGRIPPESLNSMGTGEREAVVPEPDEVRRWVDERMPTAWAQLAGEGDAAWSHVEVRVQVYGPVGQKVDLIRAFPVIVFNSAGAR
jgi:hypothetical protein